jgi:ATP-dependent Lon protease
MVVPLFVGREKSIKALQEVMKNDKSIVLITQKNSEIDEPASKDLYQYGCLSKVLQLLKLPDGTVKVLVEGEKRIKILNYNESEKNYLTSEVEIAQDLNSSKDLEPLAIGLVKKFERLQVLNKKDLSDGSNNLKNLKDPSQIANNISSNLNIQIFEKQELLETLDVKKRLEKIHQIIEKETSVLTVEKKFVEELKIKWKKLKESII